MSIEDPKSQINKRNLKALKIKFGPYVDREGIHTEIFNDIPLDLLPDQEIEFSQDPRDQLVVARLSHGTIALCKLFTEESLEVAKDSFNVRSTTYIGRLDLSLHLLYQGQSELNSYFIYRDEDSPAPVSGVMRKNGDIYESFDPTLNNMVGTLGQMIEFDVENIYVSTTIDYLGIFDEDIEGGTPIAALLITLK